MNHFVVEFDGVRGVVIARISSGFPLHQFEPFCEVLRKLVGEARQRGPLRHLSDNRGGTILGEPRSEILWHILHDNGSASDRIAVLVSDSMAKRAARQQVNERGQIFASENAAFTWLSIGSVAASAA
jgi:hypothetical protein